MNEGHHSQRSLWACPGRSRANSEDIPLVALGPRGLQARGSRRGWGCVSPQVAEQWKELDRRHWASGWTRGPRPRGLERAAPPAVLRPEAQLASQPLPLQPTLRRSPHSTSPPLTPQALPKAPQSPGPGLGTSVQQKPPGSLSKPSTDLSVDGSLGAAGLPQVGSRSPSSG